ncbi:TA system VapC family ribonuclease toxin [uncultured Microbacterium sp.]|uniref:TA system VapC family ribonuclease toxin n=1 Tax=uncultured Microbacterium sp. TaxID=191216 RepID=UPI0035CA216D
MRLVDANVLLYAVDADSRHHDAARRWLDSALSGADTVLVPWVCALAFLRLTTSARVYEKPLDVNDAIDILEGWLAQPTVVVPEPAAGHLGRLREMLSDTGSGGNLVNDAHLAALALQHRATVVTFDTDFARFPGVDWIRPA